MDPGVAVVRSYGAVFASFLRHPETKSLDTERRAGIGEGLLERRPVREGSRAYIGKESNQLEEVLAGDWGRLEDVQIEYGQALDSWFRWVVPVLKQMPLSLLMSQSRLDRRTLQRLRNRHARPRRVTERTLARIAGEWARAELRVRGLPGLLDNVLSCRAVIEGQAYRDQG